MVPVGGQGRAEQVGMTHFNLSKQWQKSAQLSEEHLDIILALRVLL